MYKNMSRVILSIAAIALITIVLGTSYINNTSWKIALADFTSTRQGQVEYYIQKTVDELNNVLLTNSVWTEAIKQLNTGNSEWIDENAAGYIIEDEAYNVDFIYVSDESKTYSESFGLDYTDVIMSSKTYELALNENQSYNEIIWVNDVPVLVIGDAFYDNDYENPEGCYIVARNLLEYEINEITQIFGVDSVQRITLTNTVMFPEVEVNQHEYINLSFPMNLGADVNYINIYSRVPFYHYIFGKQIDLVILVIIVISGFGIFIALTILKKLVKTLNEVIKSVDIIASGNYEERIKTPPLKLMPEVKQVISSINHMTSDIQGSLKVIEEHVHTIDTKYLEMVEIIVNTVEINDSYTYQHNISVSKYSLIIGELIGFDDIRNLEIAAKLHDVGKIGIPTHILNKPGKLTDEEYEIIKTHPVEGYKIVSKIDYFNKISEGIKYHHERIDGKGYPEGLKGDDIPLIAQIISIADVYDALTSDRSYRKAMSCSEAMNFLLAESGKMFNQEMVNLFYEEMKSRGCKNNH